MCFRFLCYIFTCRCFCRVQRALLRSAYNVLGLCFTADPQLGRIQSLTHIRRDLRAGKVIHFYVGDVASLLLSRLMWSYYLSVMHHHIHTPFCFSPHVLNPQKRLQFHYDEKLVRFTFSCARYTSGCFECSKTTFPLEIVKNTLENITVWKISPFVGTFDSTENGSKRGAMGVQWDFCDTGNFYFSSRLTVFLSHLFRFICKHSLRSNHSITGSVRPTECLSRLLTDADSQRT